MGIFFHTRNPQYERTPEDNVLIFFACREHTRFYTNTSASVATCGGKKLKKSNGRPSSRKKKLCSGPNRTSEPSSSMLRALWVFLLGAVRLMSV